MSGTAHFGRCVDRRVHDDRWKLRDVELRDTYAFTYTHIQPVILGRTEMICVWNRMKMKPGTSQRSRQADFLRQSASALSWQETRLSSRAFGISTLINHLTSIVWFNSTFTRRKRSPDVYRFISRGPSICRRPPKLIPLPALLPRFIESPPIYPY